jgi:hypothetical protein
VPLACDGRPADTLTLTLSNARKTYLVPEGTLACVSQVAFFPPGGGTGLPGAIVVGGGDFQAVTDAQVVDRSPGIVPPFAAPGRVEGGTLIRWTTDCACDGYFALVQFVLLAGDGRRPDLGVSGSSRFDSGPFRQDIDGDGGAPDIAFDGSQLTAGIGPLADLGLDPAGYSACWAALRTATSASIPVAGLVDGEHLCLRTDRGRVVLISVLRSGGDVLDYQPYEP